MRFCDQFLYLYNILRDTVIIWYSLIYEVCGISNISPLFVNWFSSLSIYIFIYLSIFSTSSITAAFINMANILIYIDFIPSSPPLFPLSHVHHGSHSFFCNSHLGVDWISTKKVGKKSFRQHFPDLPDIFCDFLNAFNHFVDSYFNSGLLYFPREASRIFYQFCIRRVFARLNKSFEWIETV
jgi:hypothetical protein